MLEIVKEFKDAIDKCRECENKYEKLRQHGDNLAIEETVSSIKYVLSNFEKRKIKDLDNFYNLKNSIFQAFDSYEHKIENSKKYKLFEESLSELERNRFVKFYESHNHNFTYRGGHIVLNKGKFYDYEMERDTNIKYMEDLDEYDFALINKLMTEDILYFIDKSDNEVEKKYLKSLLKEEPKKLNTKLAINKPNEKDF